MGLLCYSLTVLPLQRWVDSATHYLFYPYRDGSTPLHLACAWGMELVVQCLMEFEAEVNTQVRLGAEHNLHIHAQLTRGAGHNLHINTWVKLGAGPDLHIHFTYANLLEWILKRLEYQACLYSYIFTRTAFFVYICVLQHIWNMDLK